MKKRVRKYAEGGNIPSDIETPYPEPVYPPRPDFPSPGRTAPSPSGGNSAYGAINDIRTGTEAAEQALSAAAQNIGSPSSGDKGGVFGGGLPRMPVFSFKKGGVVSGASKRADGIAQRGKTRGRYL